MKPNIKLSFTLLGAFVLLLAFGPGCGGGGTDSGSGSGGDPIVKYSVEATKGGSIIDPTNIVQGETVQFIIAGYTAANARIVQSSSGWSADPTGQGEGTMSSSGQFVASASGAQFTVTGSAGANTRTGAAQVRTPGALVTGHVINGYGSSVPGAVVDFYDAGSNLVGSSKTQFDGSFRASVPVTAVTFELNKSAIPSGYYKEYSYSSKWYLPLGICRAPLPSLTLGQTKSLSNITLPPTTLNGASLAPPPPPSACT